jgi:hypothetical protein
MYIYVYPYIYTNTPPYCTRSEQPARLYEIFLAPEGRYSRTKLYVSKLYIYIYTFDQRKSSMRGSAEPAEVSSTLVLVLSLQSF